MPIFEYKCKSCGTVSDILVGVTAEQPEVACVECGNTDLVKLISAVNFSMGESHSPFHMAGGCACGHGEEACGCEQGAGAGACACGGAGCGQA